MRILQKMNPLYPSDTIQFLSTLREMILEGDKSEESRFERLQMEAEDLKGIALADRAKLSTLSVENDELKTQINSLKKKLRKQSASEEKENVQ